MFNMREIIMVEMEWYKVNWKVVNRVIFWFQKRIYKVLYNGDIKVVKKFQKLLVKFKLVRLFVVRRVIQDNIGKKILGIDGVGELVLL